MFQLFITVTAANLYDSVFLYARALDKLLKNETYLNDTIIDDIAKNGSVIVQTIIKDRKYKSKLLMVSNINQIWFSMYSLIFMCFIGCNRELLWMAYI